ncbi:DUF748 domain-containing protein [Piscinibacter sp.]|uniref:DUF748 domain-containing protein n=1 Tax=Piscinibacter sp. TaxID=1903157 RepID=UPI0039E2FE1F
MPITLPSARRFLRTAAIAVLALLALWLLLWLAVPPILKSQAQQRLGELLGRPVAIGEVDFRPWSLELTLRELDIAGPPGAERPLLHAGRAYADADIASLWRRAPVLAALEVDGLRINLTHLAPGRYDIDDLLARFAPDPAAKPSEPARFALFNLRLDDAAIRFDDRPAGRVHTVDSLRLALPFVSNLPALVDVTVQPHLAFRLDGAAFDSGASALPFAERRRGELRLKVADLDLSRYAVYLPATLPLRLQRGRLAADLALRFEQRDDGVPALALSGSSALKDVALADPNGAPLLAWTQLQIDASDVQPLMRRVALAAVRLDGAQLDLARDAAGRLNLPQAPRGEAAASAPAATPTGPAWQASIERLDVDGARVRWNDAAVRPAAALQLEALRLRGEKLAWPASAAMPLSLDATLRGQRDAAPPAGKLAVQARVAETSAEGSISLDGLALAELAPYLADVLRPRLEGRAGLKSRFEWSGDAAAPKQTLWLDELALDELKLGGELSLRRLALASAQVDLLARQAELGKLTLDRPTVELARDEHGRWNLASLRVAGDAPPPPEAGRAEAPWKLRLAALQLDGGRVRLADRFAAGRAAETPLRVEASALRLRLDDFAWPSGKGVAPARMQLSARVGEAGRIDWSGRVAPEPLLVAGRLRIEQFPVHAFEAYFADRMPFALLRADAGWQGGVDVRQSAAGWTVQASGDARLADLRLHTRDARGGDGDELLSWQRFTLDGVRFAMAPQATPQLDIREAALNDFFARLVVTEQGRLNLSAAAAPAEAASAPPAEAAASAASAPAAAASAPTGRALPIALSVGGVKLGNGRIDFADHFVRPNYSAQLTELNGTLGAFRSGSPEMAALELRGRAAGTALLDVRGALNPTADPLALDIQAKATDLELAPLSPYAGKYAGYAIERGKLSMEVAYKIAPDGKLEARNQLILNQLTFGDKVDSPDATKLPVLLAVALLKDRNGVIDLDLPISGSINDPQFSVVGIVFKLIGNLLAKALTAPFALLAGGGGEDLSVVEFRPGTALVGEAGRATLDKVAKALAERGALKLTVTGSADPAGEREAWQRATLQARLVAERRREMLRAGAPAAEADALRTLDEATRLRVLKDVYRRAELPDKPRNALGFARDIPPAEMAALLERHIDAGPDAMRELALQRGLAVRDALLAAGLPGERVFLAAPRLGGEGDDKGAARAQLSLSTK